MSKIVITNFSKYYRVTGHHREQLYNLMTTDINYVLCREKSVDTVSVPFSLTTVS